MGYNTFEEMPVWGKAMELSVVIFKLTEKLPRKEDYGLTSQIRRAALSISANIAEGFGRKHIKDKLNFYYNARGSLSETKNHLIYGHEVRYFNDIEFEELTGKIEILWKDLNFIIASLCKISQPQPQP
jgi:four helix bundle protein